MGRGALPLLKVILSHEFQCLMVMEYSYKLYSISQTVHQWKILWNRERESERGGTAEE